MLAYRVYQAGDEFNYGSALKHTKCLFTDTSSATAKWITSQVPPHPRSFRMLVSAALALLRLACRVVDCRRRRRRRRRRCIVVFVRPLRLRLRRGALIVVVVVLLPPSPPSLLS